MVVLWFYLSYLLQASGLLREGGEWSAEVGAELPVCPPHVSAEAFLPTAALSSPVVSTCRS